MKYLALIFCALFSVTLAVPATQAPSPATEAPVVELTPPPLPTLAQDLHELQSLMQTKNLKSLINRYLLNDAEFQSVVRVLNSHDAIMAFRKFMIQPEIIDFTAWLEGEIARSGGEGCGFVGIGELNLFDYCGSSVYGWQGFMTEFLVTYPEYNLNKHIQLKKQQSVSFAAFWQRVHGLHVVFDRFMLFPETQQLTTLMQEHNIDIMQLENFIRQQLDWVVPPTVVVNAEPAANAEPAVEVAPVA